MLNTRLPLLICCGTNAVGPVRTTDEGGYNPYGELNDYEAEGETGFSQKDLEPHGYTYVWGDGLRVRQQMAVFS